MTALLSHNAALFTLVAGILGLIVGSFLNVVVHRLPIMMEREWRAQCALTQGQPLPETESVRFDLIEPRSRCPHCAHQVTALENIPLLSYVWLRGKCSSCKAPISVRYPLVELLTALLSAAVAWRFGYGWEAAAGITLTWCLVALSFIDYDTQLLPDSITLPLIWLGLLLSLHPVWVSSDTAIVGAVAGYLLLWSVYQAFRLTTGKEGMGFGDFKLLSALGAWFGWKMLGVIVLLSSAAGAVVGILLMALRGHGRDKPIPFGPYIALAGWIAMMWGESLLNWYLRSLV